MCDITGKDESNPLHATHTLILFKTLTLQFYAYLVSEKVNKGKKVND